LASYDGFIVKYKHFDGYFENMQGFSCSFEVGEAVVVIDIV